MSRASGLQGPRLLGVLSSCLDRGTREPFPLYCAVVPGSNGFNTCARVRVHGLGSKGEVPLLYNFHVLSVQGSVAEAQGLRDLSRCCVSHTIPPTSSTFTPSAAGRNSLPSHPVRICHTSVRCFLNHIRNSSLRTRHRTISRQV